MMAPHRQGNRMSRKQPDPDRRVGPHTGSSAPGHTGRPLERAIGEQVRALRQQHNLSVADLAAAAGMSQGAISKIENGQTSASLTALQSIAGALGVPISSLFDAYEQKHDCSYVPAGKGVMIERRGTKVGHLYNLLGHARSNDLIMEPYLITLREDAEPYTGFLHSGLEFVHMLTGNLVYRHGDRSYDLHAGDSLMFDPGALHGPERLRTPTVTYLSIIVYPRDKR